MDIQIQWLQKPNIMGVRTSALGQHWFQGAYVTAAK